MQKKFFFLTIKAYFFFAIQKIYEHMPYFICTWCFRQIDYFHYKALTHFEHPVETKRKEGGIIGNECYGNLWAVKNAMKKDFHSNCMIEHGVYFGENVLESECTILSIDTIYTFSEYRKNAILKWFDGGLNKNIIPVGPYILYVDNFKSKRTLKKLKDEFGKVLLVFPSHPFPGEDIEYDMVSFLNEIKKVALDYDTVLISLGWLDVRYGNDKVYLEKGYKVVCSGGRMDRWFLNRQRDLFELADFSMSNDVGTHIGYSVAMGVPHYLYEQPIKVVLAKEKEAHVKNKVDETRKKEYDEIKSAFNIRTPIITKRQIEIVNHYWGFNIALKNLKRDI